MSNTHRKSIGDMVPVIDEVISAGGNVRLDVKGYSMWPLLRSEIDSVLLKKPTDIKKYDVVLFKRTDGTFALHRIVKITNSSLTTVGDNQYIFDQTVTPDAVIAKAVEFQRGKRRIGEKNIRLFGVFWVALFPLRRLLRKGLSWIKNHLPVCIRSFVNKFR